jgi:hypothetical protein
MADVFDYFVGKHEMTRRFERHVGTVQVKYVYLRN